MNIACRKDATHHTNAATAANAACRVNVAHHAHASCHTNVARLHKVSLFYGKTAALRDISLSIAPGEHLCVLGGNGSGKSTLALVLAGLLAPDEGSVELAQQLVYDDTRIGKRIDNEAYKQARRSLGLVFQNPDEQIVTSIVEDDVAFGPENLGLNPAEIQKRVRRELHRVAMQDYAQAHPMCLSGGQKQRVALAGALAMHPQLLVLDEPGALLDVRGRRSVMHVLDKLKKAGTTVVHVTHFMDEALKADRVLVMHQGSIVADDTPDAIFQHVEKIEDSQLELPFTAQLATKLQQVNIAVSWTTSREALCRELSEQLKSRSTIHDGITQADAVATNDAFIAAKNLCFSYEPNSRWSRAAEREAHTNRRTDTQTNTYAALLDLNFSIQKGSYTALIGQTGSGKTTLVRLLCGLAKPSAGSLIVAGHNTQHKRDRQLLHGLIGYVMQQPERQLFAETVYDDVAFGPHNLQLAPEEVAQRTKQALQAVGLWHKKDTSPFELSGGQARLAALAGILAMQPKILLVDEPTAGLDPKGRREVLQLLKRIHAAGTTLVHITHAMEEAALAEKIIVLNQSRILLQGTPQEIFTPAHQALLTNNGLDLPEPLLFAQQLNQQCGREVLGQTLSLSELIASITDCVRAPMTAATQPAAETEPAATTQLAAATQPAAVAETRLAATTQLAAATQPANCVHSTKAEGVGKKLQLEAQKAPISQKAPEAYTQTNSWMTHLDARTKLVVGLIYMISVLFIQTPLQLALGLISACGLVLLAKVPPKSVLCAIRPAVSMLLILGLCNLLIVARGEVLFSLGFIRITTQGLHIALIFSLRMIGALVCAAVLFLTTTPTQVTDAFEKLLQPFARFGLPARELALILSLMVRFIPLLAYEALLIKDAQAMRGAGREGASFSQKLQALQAFLIALLSSSLHHAHGLARSLDARCYESDSPRTHYKPSVYHVQDGIAYVALVVYLAGLLGMGLCL